MTEVLVLVQRDIARPALPQEALFVPFHTAVDAVVSLRASSAPAVVVTDGLDTEDLDSIAAAVRGRTSPCVEVRYERWDGQTQSAVSGACRGVISGFGEDGVRRAVELLSAS